MGLDEVPDAWGPSVVTIGVFDGVHRGHQRIVTTAAAAAAGLGLPLVVATFDPHPAEVIRPGSHPLLLCTLRRRAQLLAELGAAAVCVLEFTLEFSRLGPDEFVRAVLADRLHARCVVVGENFRFGHRAAGDLALLAELGEKYDFRAEGVPLLARGRRHDVVKRDQGPAGRGGRGRRGARAWPAAPGRGRGGARRPARPGARHPHREPGDGAAHGHPRRRRVRRVAGQPRRGRATRRSAGPRRSPSAPTPPSTGSTGSWRRTRWTGTTSTCTGCTSPWTSRPGCAAWSSSTRWTRSSRQMRLDIAEARALVTG